MTRWIPNAFYGKPPSPSPLLPTWCGRPIVDFQWIRYSHDRGVEYSNDPQQVARDNLEKMFAA